VDDGGLAIVAAPQDDDDEPVVEVDIDKITSASCQLYAKDDCMITIDPTTGIGTLVITSDVLVEGLTLSKETSRTVFYGSVNTELWVYDMDADTLEIACTNLLGETEALEMMPDGILLMGIDKDKSFSLHAFDAKACQVVVEADMPTNQFNDVEGIALPIEACAK
jgi:hypothetical protein